MKGKRWCQRILVAYVYTFLTLSWIHELSIFKFWPIFPNFDINMRLYTFGFRISCTSFHTLLNIFCQLKNFIFGFLRNKSNSAISWITDATVTILYFWNGTIHHPWIYYIHEKSVMKGLIALIFELPIRMQLMLKISRKYLLILRARQSRK